MNHISSRGEPDRGAIEAIVQARHWDPFAVLGPHEVEGGVAVRAFLADATAVQVIGRDDDHVLGTLERIDAAGFWCGMMAARMPYRLRVTSGDMTVVREDPYAFGPSLGELDIYLLAEGRHQQVGKTLGAHVLEHQSATGVRFAVWAPNARRVSVVGDFNRWDGRCHPMRLHIGAGVWEIFIPGLLSGTVYKYELVGPNNELLPLKADPVAGAAERPPATASIVIDEALSWHDDEWLSHRAAAQATAAPISLYEVHAPSWFHPTDDERDGWEQLADRLVPYVQRMRFTHIELMPVMEHPFGGSWGYQPLGQYAPSARMGSPEGFAYLVDKCHQAGIGVILDWVPAHFPTDAHGLARFDGTPLYEHGDPREGFHHDWNTYIYNLGRNEVRAFLIGSAVHWLEHYHADGLRVDAVASMLYRDYSRKHGEWVPNQYGGRENLEAVSFLRELSGVLRDRCPGTVLIAEESTAWPGVSRSVDEGGLGFDFKWNMGWMHDTLHFMEEEPINRAWHHDELTFGLVYAFSEKFILPLSHDEVVYGKGSMIGKMRGDLWQKFANLRAYYGFMWSHPGKKLLFMGGEIAQWREWNHDASLDWHLLDDPNHSGVQLLVRDLNQIYRDTPALFRKDHDSAGFRWVVLDDRSQSVFVYLRLGEPGDAPVLVACNFTPVPRLGYRVGVPSAGHWTEILNTDAAVYGGSNMGNGGGVNAQEVESHGLSASLVIDLPPLATIMLKAF
jgi:1,4-alpha-glucan branching enzyme